MEKQINNFLEFMKNDKKVAANRERICRLWCSESEIQ